jgi:hypothetical protein
VLELMVDIIVVDLWVKIIILMEIGDGALDNYVGFAV